MSTILEVRNLVKHYKEVNAVNGVSLKIPSGCCFGLLGPNGAGKTTTIEMIEGITSPTSGEIFYKGQLDNPRFKSEAGIQFQSTALMDYLTVEEFLTLFGSFYSNPQPTERLVEQCHLTEFRSQQAAKLSGGQRQRVLLAIALINDPDIIFLDEPTTGLDPQSRRNFWTLLENIKKQGKTIVLTTHYMDEAEYLCDQLVIVDQGKIIAEGSPHALLQQQFDHVLVCLDASALNTAQQQQLTAQRHNEQVIIKSRAVEETLQTLISAGISLTSLQIRNPTLEDLFLQLTGHSLRD